MAVSANIYANAFDQAFQGNIKWPSDTLKMLLLSSSYTPNLTSHIHYSDVSADEITGTGYTAGGAALSTVTHVVTGASSWSVTWTASTAYSVGQIVVPTTSNGYVYRVSVAGTSAASAPTFPTTVGETVTDGGVTWVNAGESVTVFSSAAVSWSSSTLTASYAVIYDSSSGSASTDPLICLINFGESVASSGGTYSVTPDSHVGWFAITPA